jgi:DNA-binding NtrC family response regulator
MTAADPDDPAIDPSLAVVIDDDASLRDLIASILVRLGMKVAAFQTAKEALAAIDEVAPTLVFLDVALLRSDAIDVLRGLGERRYGGMVQLMSGGRHSLLEAVYRIGTRHGLKLAAPLHKPLTHDAIVTALAGLRAQTCVPVEHIAASAKPILQR